MPHLDNDMDELFQRAGEYYSPQKGAGDWESIAKRIASKSNPPRVAAPKNKRNKILLILTLLLAGLSIGGYMFQNNLADIFYSNNAGRLLNDMANDSDTSHIKNNNGHLPAVTEAFAVQTANSENNSYRKSLNASSGNMSNKAIHAILPGSLHSNIRIESLNEKKTEDDLINETSHIDFEPWQNFKETASEVLLKNLIKDRKEISEQLKFSNQKLTNHLLIKTLQGQEDHSYSITKNNRKGPGNITHKNKNFYLGIVAGIDFSKVQSRSFHHSGYGAGILLGLKVNTKLSFETGAIFNEKNYTSEGRYFKMAKVSSAMPSGMVITDLEGQSSLIEIPIKIKYDVISNRNSDLFIAAGVSSYIMTNEKNIYNVVLNGNHQQTTGVYEKNSYRLPAVANVSIGYEHNISKYLGIRIEPFLKIPLQGIGVGSLPVTSAGLQIGITSRLN